MVEAAIFMGTILGSVLLSITIVATIEMEQPPRGFRWLVKAWGGIKWAALRVFYPEEVKPAPPVPAGPPGLGLEALEVWHACYELGHEADECDRIAYLHPALWVDVMRRHKHMKAKELRK